MTRPLALTALLLTAAACTAGQATDGPNYLGMPAPAATCHAVDGRADRHCTPGALNPAVTQATIHATICVKGWTATIRPPASYTTELKHRQMAEYGVTGPLNDYHEDHMIPLEIGGAPQDPSNLWPEPVTGSVTAAIKDRLENSLHRQVCDGSKTLIAAQREIVTAWTSP